MDYFALVASGRVAKVLGWHNTPAGARVYRFTLAANRKFGSDERTVFLQCSVQSPECHQIAERGLIVGESVLIEADWLEPNASQRAGQVTVYLNCRVRRVYFLGAPQAATESIEIIGGLAYLPAKISS